MKLVVFREEMADIHRLHEFLAEKETPAAQRAVASPRTAIRSLEVFPGRGRLSGIPGARELVVPFGRSAYLVRYAYLQEQDKMVVMRVWHGREARS